MKEMKRKTQNVEEITKEAVPTKKNPSEEVFLCRCDTTWLEIDAIVNAVHLKSADFDL